MRKETRPYQVSVSLSHTFRKIRITDNSISVNIRGSIGLDWEEGVLYLCMVRFET